jgi:DNA repair protein RadC
MRTKKNKNQLIELPEYPVPQIKLIYKPDFNFDSRPIVGNTLSAGQFFLYTWDRDTVQMQEKFRVLLLSRAQKVIGVYESTVGTATSTLVDPRLVFSASILANATSIVIAHNHPSGNLEPSDTDKWLTEKMIKAGRLLDIDVEDSIIVTKDRYFSFKESNLIK